MTFLQLDEVPSLRGEFYNNILFAVEDLVFPIISSFRQLIVMLARGSDIKI
jgi:hypothetical protein